MSDWSSDVCSSDLDLSVRWDLLADVAQGPLVWKAIARQMGPQALRTHPPPGPAPTKAERALEVAEEVLAAPVADRPNRTLPRLADEIEKRSGLRISRSRLSVVPRQRGRSAGDGLVTR